MERLQPKFAEIANGTTWYRDISCLPLKPPQSFKPRIVIKTGFFVFLWIWPEPVRGSQREENFQKTSLKARKKFSAFRPPSFLFFKLVSSTPWPFCCFYLMYASFRSVKDKNSKILTPTRTGNFLFTSMDREFYATLRIKVRGAMQFTAQNAWVLEMQNFTQAYTKGWTYVRMIFSQPKFSDPWCSAALALREGSAIILFWHTHKDGPQILNIDSIVCFTLRMQITITSYLPSWHQVLAVPLAHRRTCSLRQPGLLQPSQLHKLCLKVSRLPPVLGFLPQQA